MISPKTQHLIDTHKPRIAEKLRTLDRLLQTFGESLAQESSPSVVFDPVTDDDESMLRFDELDAGTSLEAAVSAFAQLDYGMDDRVNRSVRCYGALGVPRRLINDAKVVNRAKSDFKAAMRSIAGRRVRVTVRDRHGDDAVVVKSLSNIILRQLQRSSLNVLAAYRAIPLLEETPHAIHFMQTQVRSVPRKTAQELLDQLDGRDDAAASADRERLSGLEPNEYLVSPKAPYPRMRAHVFSRKLDDEGKPARRIVLAELPILYPIRQRVRPPDLVAPSVRNKPRKKPQSFIETEEFVKTLHFRRMQKGHRKFAEPTISRRRTRR